MMRRPLQSSEASGSEPSPNNKNDMIDFGQTGGTKFSSKNKIIEKQKSKEEEEK